MGRNRVLGLPIGALAGLAVLSTVVAGPQAAASAATAHPGSSRAGSSPAAPVPAALQRAFEAARHIPPADVAGIAAGTLHVGSAAGREWAIASFTPTRTAVRKISASFQDGAATGVFAQADGAWHLVRTGLYGCGDGLPAALKS
ncbi:MAG: hypothetical protein ACRDRJ_23245, partial [Streptosporangiaceae bacterium]